MTKHRPQRTLEPVLEHPSELKAYKTLRRLFSLVDHTNYNSFCVCEPDFITVQFPTFSVVLWGNIKINLLPLLRESSLHISRQLLCPHNSFLFQSKLLFSRE